MIKGADFSLSEASAVRAVLLLAIGYLLVGYLTLTPGHTWGDDWAQYVNHARNLATGRAYSDTGYIFNPSVPRVGPPSYPPGFPLLLAPIVRIFGLDITALKSVSLACMTAAIVATFMLFRYALGAWVAAGAAFLFGLHDFSLALPNYVVSEPAYTLWALTSLYFASRPVTNRCTAAACLSGVFAFAAFATRPIGISLIVAVALYEGVQRGFLRWRFCCIAGIPAAGILLQRHFLTLGDYSAELHFPAVHQIATNVLGYWKAAATLLPLGGRLSLLSPLAIAGLALVGIVYRLWPAVGQAGPEIVGSVMPRATLPGRDVLVRIPPDLWYLGLYLSALVVLPFETNARYLFPILPIVAAYVVYAVKRALDASRYARPAIAVFVGVCVCYYGALYWAHHGTHPEDDALCDDCRAMYTFIQTRTDPHATVAFAKPRAMALLADRRSWVWAENRDRQFISDELRSAHIDYIVLVPPDHPLASKYPAYLAWDAWRSDSTVSLVFENHSFRVLRLSQESP